MFLLLLLLLLRLILFAFTWCFTRTEWSIKYTKFHTIKTYSITFVPILMLMPGVCMQHLNFQSSLHSRCDKAILVYIVILEALCDKKKIAQVVMARGSDLL